MVRYASLAESVGHTPLVGLPQLSPSESVRLWAKLEDYNPTGSIKDRAAFQMIKVARLMGHCAPVRRFSNRPAATRHFARDGSQAARLPVDLCDAGEHLPERKQLLAIWGAEIVFHRLPEAPTRPSVWRRCSRRSIRTG